MSAIKFITSGGMASIGGDLAQSEQKTANDIVKSFGEKVNVSLEVGYMLGMGKNVLLLKDKTLKQLQTDLTGKLYKPFDTTDVENTMPQQIEKWLTDKGLR